MPKGFKVNVSPEQIEVVRQLVVGRGLKARGISRLNPGALSGLRENNIQRIISALGLVDPEWSLRCKGTTRLPPPRKQQLIAYLESHPGQPDSQAALDNNVSREMVVRLRLQRFGKREGPRRYSQAIEERRQKNISRCYARKRRERYWRLLALRSKSRASADPSPERWCKVCGENWPREESFFPLRQSPCGKFFSHTCVICEAEIKVLKKAGKTPEEISNWKRSGIWRPPELTHAVLIAAAFERVSTLPTDSSVCSGSAQSEAECHKCGMPWPHSRQFFQACGSRLLNICLACPSRKFASR